MSGLSLDICTSNLKSVALTVLELLAFNPENLGGRMTLAMPDTLHVYKFCCTPPL